jgi:phospholipid/cholesterol/gamma-HCH transport system ATP-binding protein
VFGLRKRRADAPANGAPARPDGPAAGEAPGPPKQPGDPHVVVDKIVKRFGETEVLRGVSMTVRRGETAVIIGGSGAGKTTLLRILIGLEKPTSGRILVDGLDLAPLEGVELNRARRKFGMVFQYSALLDSLNIFENVAFPLVEHTKMSKAEIRDKVKHTLEILGIGGTETRFPSELSGGMRKRVGLARALMLEPEVLIYDEPTSGLDPLTSRMVDDLIEETRQRFGVTNLVISHDMASTFRIAHRAFLLIRGQVVAEGRPDDLLEGTSEVARDFVLKSGVDTRTISRAPPIELAGTRRDEKTAVGVDLD